MTSLYTAPRIDLSDVSDQSTVACVSALTMAFDLNRLWDATFGGKLAQKTPVPPPPPSKKPPPDEEESEEEEEDKEEDKKSASESESESEASEKPRSDASKDLDSNDTVMDVHSQVLEVSHSSVLARPHPPPLRKRHRFADVEVEKKVDEAVVDVQPISTPPAAPIPIPPPGPRSVKAARAIRAKPKKLPWYKKVSSAVKRKSKQVKDKLSRKKADKPKITKKEAKNGEKRSWREKMKEKLRSVRSPFGKRNKPKTATTVGQKATQAQKKTQDSKRQVNKKNGKPKKRKTRDNDKKCQLQ